MRIGFQWMFLGIAVVGGSQVAFGQIQVAVVQVVKKAPTVLTLTPVATSHLFLGGSVDVAAKVGGIAGFTPTGIVTYTATNEEGTTVSIDTPVSAAGTASWSAQLTSGTYSVVATYHGDSNYLASTAPQTSEIVVAAPQDFTFTLSATEAVVKQGDTWAGTANLKSLNGFTGTVTFNCGEMPPQISCGFGSQSLTLTPVADATSAASIITVPTTVATLSGIGMLLGLLELRRRHSSLIQKLTALTIGAMFALIVIGCGVKQRYAQTNGTPRGTYKIVVNATSGAISHSQTVMVTVK